MKEPKKHTPKTVGHVHRVAEQRGTVTERGYGADWRKTRAAKMLATALAQGYSQAMCEHCLKDGRLTPATDVDHIKRRTLGGSDAPENLQCLCHACHSRKTRQEMNDDARRGVH